MAVDRMSMREECANFAQYVNSDCANFAHHLGVRLLHNCDMDKDWIKSRMRSLKVTQADIAMRLNKDRSIISRIINGIQDLQLDEIPVFAELLQIPISEMLARAGLPGDGVFSPNVQPVESPVMAVRVVGIVEAGNFRPADEHEYDDQETVYVTADPRFAGLPHFALQLRGPSMNQLYPEGSTVVCISLLHLGAGFTLKSGNKVIVERRNEFGDVESTVKEIIFVSDKEAWLWPRSDHPQFQTPWPVPMGNGDEMDSTDRIRISAVVAFAVRKEL